MSYHFNENFNEHSKSYIEQQIIMYKQNNYIISDEQYKEMISRNDSTCLSYIRFHTNKSKGSWYMSTSHFTKLLVDTYNYHNEQIKNHSTESFSLNIDDAGFLVYIDADYDFSNIDVNTATQINNELSKNITVIANNTIHNQPINENINILTFIPQQLTVNELGLIKGGIHSFIKSLFISNHAIY